MCVEGEENEEGEWEKGVAYQNLLSIADTPGQVPHIAVCLDDFWCEFNSKPIK